MLQSIRTFFSGTLLWNFDDVCSSSILSFVDFRIYFVSQRDRVVKGSFHFYFFFFGTNGERIVFPSLLSLSFVVNLFIKLLCP